MVLYIPPANFGMVEDNLYRSGQPNELNYPFIEQLKLKTIISLAPDQPNPSLLKFIEEHNIKFLHLGRERSQASWQLVSEDVVLEALSYVLNLDNYPLYLMCHLGRHRTGTVVGCLRKVQRWNLASIFEEYRRYAGIKVRLLNEQFIELFDTDLVHIDNHPPWV